MCSYNFQIGMEIEVRPGLVSKDSEGKLTCRPIFSRIVSLFAEQNELQFAVPGGLIGNILFSINSMYHNFKNQSKIINNEVVKHLCTE